MGPRIIVVILSGVLLSTLVAPWGFAWLHWVAYLPLFWALREETPRANRWLSVLYGTVAEALIFSWIAETITLFSNIPGVLAWAVNALFAVVFGVVYPLTFIAVHPLRKRLGDWWIVALPSWLVVVEYLTMNVILFPYNQGVSQYRTPAIWQLASITGVWGISWLMLFFNAAFAEWIYRRREGRPPPVRWMGAALGVVALVALYGTWRYRAVEQLLAAAPVTRFQQVQDDITMTERLSTPRAEGFQWWLKQTEAIPRGEVDVAVWPEGACPYQLNESTHAITLWQLADARATDLIIGAGTREREGDPAAGEKGRVRIFNSVYFFDRDRLATATETPADVWATLTTNGCDVDAVHLWLPIELALVAQVGNAAASLEPADPARQCVARLQAAEQAQRVVMKVDAEFEAWMAADADVWPRLRAETARFARQGDAAAVVETFFQRKKAAGAWTLQDGACPDGDCKRILVGCVDGDGCSVYPEPVHYDKMVPLPFGEYLPLAETFPWLADIIKGPGDFRAGETPLVVDLGTVRVATPICYEAILGYVCDQFEEPDVLVNVTNDAWFGPTAASDLHGMLAAVRAIELGVPVFRSAYSGVSFVVEPHGAIVSEAPLFTEVNRVVGVRVATVPTIYRQLGDWFVALSAVLLGALWFGVGRRGGAAGTAPDDAT